MDESGRNKTAGVPLHCPACRRVMGDVSALSHPERRICPCCFAHVTLVPSTIVHHVIIVQSSRGVDTHRT